MNQAVNQDRKPIDVMLADSNPLVLSALSEVIDRDPRFSLVATTATAEGFLGTVMRVPVQIGIINWSLPALGGAKLIEVLRDQENAPRIIVYADDTGDLPRLAMTAGAAAFASRSSPAETLLDTCVDVAAGKMVFPFLDVRELQSDPIHLLSRKERATLDALSKGLTNRELAKELSISTNTVKFHLTNLYEKLSVKNRAQAIAFYYSSRLALERDQDDGIPK
ncbi:response regulator transcription factor [Roseobacter litoralis]|uniref:HTH-type transcriptional regulator, LuxR family n=1 Tax=Roseobacter litoralis (strain ATCC 49566 / DSM 6996 / JCM 21268 / NBRC 15278 / OCh 149) TaxID=391595 RepID=F7ZBM0_ROSLO|nr:HTH-type transcriptional regulator, LuxR family [Roseobacter litoralis Och 149]GIT88863.1 DNA-binding response regulator [Roseobacter sp. OBYS 0001]